MARRPGTPAPPSTAMGPARSTGPTATGPGSRVKDRTAAEGQRVAAQAADEAQEVASTAQEKGQQVATAATEEARQVGATVKNQAARVKGEVVEQGRTLAEEARSQLESQAQAQSRHLADVLSRLGDEIWALAEGRPEDADTFVPYVSRAADAVYEGADRLYILAEDIDEGGLPGVLDDVQAFARRRPGAFLLGAAVAGLAVGRAARAASSDQAEPPPPLTRRPR